MRNKVAYRDALHLELNQLNPLDVNVLQIININQQRELEKAKLHKLSPKEYIAQYMKALL